MAFVIFDWSNGTTSPERLMTWRTLAADVMGSPVARAVRGPDVLGAGRPILACEVAAARAWRTLRSDRMGGGWGVPRGSASSGAPPRRVLGSDLEQGRTLRARALHRGRGQDAVEADELHVLVGVATRAEGNEVAPAAVEELAHRAQHGAVPDLEDALLLDVAHDPAPRAVPAAERRRAVGVEEHLVEDLEARLEDRRLLPLPRPAVERHDPGRVDARRPVLEVGALLVPVLGHVDHAHLDAAVVAARVAELDEAVRVAHDRVVVDPRARRLVGLAREAVDAEAHEVEPRVQELATLLLGQEPAVRV